MEILHFLPLIDSEIDFHLILVINSVLLNLIIKSFWLIGMCIVPLTCQNRLCISKESGSFRPWVVSAWVVSANFWGGSFRPKKVGRFGPGSFRPRVVSIGGRDRGRIG